MSRVLKIVSVAVLLFLGYMWISVLTKSCNKSKEIEFPNQKEVVQKNDEFGKEDFFEENDTTSIDPPVTNPTTENKKEPIDYTEIDKTIQDSKTVAPKESPNNEKINTSKPQGSVAKPKETKITEKPAVKPTIKAIVKPSPKPVELPSSSKEKSIVKSSNYVVIAGNYLVEGNADAMIKRLKKAGFKAEKVVFNLSEFHTVIVGRYNDNAAAAKTAFNLKEKGFDVYVQKPK